MADVKNLMFLDLTGLGQYDAKIKTYIDEADDKSLKGLAINGNTLLAYKDLPIEGATPAYEIELPETDLSGVIAKFEAATAGNVITVAEDGKTIVDSGIALANLATDEELADVQAIADEAKTKGLALEALMGVIPETSKAETLVAYIQELTSGIATDAALAELQADVDKVQEDISGLRTDVDKLNGDATVEGSVDYKVAQEIAKIVADAPESLDDLKEISTWITTHETDAAGMNLAIQNNKTAIEALESYVGTLPEGATATTVVGYITEALENADLTKYALASDLTAAIDRIAANENAIKVINAALAEGGTTYNQIVEAKKAGTDAQTDVDNLAAYVGTFTAIGDETTVIGYIDAKVAKVNADIEARLAAVETAVETKADKSDVEALTTRVATAEGNITQNAEDIASLAETVNGIGVIEETDINALFE